MLATRKRTAICDIVICDIAICDIVKQITKSPYCRSVQPIVRESFFHKNKAQLCAFMLINELVGDH